ncbi:MAG: hypothetical protein GY839_15260, partial [candidate division Zixibacteria bacterium]|nr:hypothetical protein [candidate division Zixibacteria bacterium]
MGVLKSVDDRKQISPELLMRMEKVSQEFRVLHECLSSKTELAGRSSINEIYHWVAAGHMERSIYLAGVARGRRLKEPYRTQIQLLPANACMFRYLQVKSIDNQKQLTDESLENNLNDVVLQML